MKDLIVRPIQRIPRYELLIQVKNFSFWELYLMAKINNTEIRTRDFCVAVKHSTTRPIKYLLTLWYIFLQRLLDNTPRDHPDSPLLQQACRVMHDLAVKIGTVNDSQHEEDMQETLKKLELLLITDVRKFFKYLIQFYIYCPFHILLFLSWIFFQQSSYFILPALPVLSWWYPTIATAFFAF